MVSWRGVEASRQNAAFVAIVAAVAAAGFAAGAARRGAPVKSAGVLDAVPRDAWLVVTVDVAALRESPLAKPLMAAGVADVVSIAKTCGFDPVARLRELAIASPEGGEKGEFGVAFTGDVTKDDLAACADKTIRARGGKPVASTRGSFAIVDDPSDAKRGRVAYRDGGPFLVGRGAWLDAMMDAAEGKTPRASDNDAHASLRRALVHDRDAPRAAVLTASLPKSLREKLKGEMSAELASESDKTWAGVLSVDRAGIAMTAGASTDLSAELRCETAEACDAVARFIERKRASFSRDFGVRLVGLGALLDSLSVEVRGPSLSATAHGPTEDLARALARFAPRDGG